MFVPTGLADSISRPADLTPAAAPIWDVLLADLTEMGVYKEADSLILVEVCEMLARAKQIRTRLDSPRAGWWNYERDLSKDEKEQLSQQYEFGTDEQRAQLDEDWPMSTAYKRLRTDYIQTMRMLKSWIDEYGLTPVARLRLGLLSLQGASLSEMLLGGDDAPPPDAVRVIDGDGS